MKKISVFAFLLILCACNKDDANEIVTCDTSQNNYILTTQADVDAFQCTQVEGNLFINEAAITDLSGLASLERVGGRLEISRVTATNLNGLQKLKSVGEYIAIRNCPNLTSVNGLEGLTTVPNITLFTLPELRSIQALRNVSDASLSALIFDFLAALESLQGVDHIQSLGRLRLDNLNALQNLDDLSNLREVKGDFWLGRLSRLTSLDGLSNLESVGAGLDNSINDTDIYIRNCGMITNLDAFVNIDNLLSGEASITIDENSDLTDFCGITNWVQANPDAVLSVRANSYNPTRQQIESETECRL